MLAVERGALWNAGESARPAGIADKPTKPLVAMMSAERQRDRANIAFTAITTSLRCPFLVNAFTTASPDAKRVVTPARRWRSTHGASRYETPKIGDIIESKRLSWTSHFVCEGQNFVCNMPPGRRDLARSATGAVRGVLTAACCSVGCRTCPQAIARLYRAPVSDLFHREEKRLTGGAQVLGRERRRSGCLNSV